MVTLTAAQQLVLLGTVRYFDDDVQRRATTTATAEPISPCGEQPPAAFTFSEVRTTLFSIINSVSTAMSPLRVITTATAEPISRSCGARTVNVLVYQSIARPILLPVEVRCVERYCRTGRLRRRRQNRPRGFPRRNERSVLICVAQRLSATHWGQSSDFVVPGDYDGDGKTDFAVFRTGRNILGMFCAVQTIQLFRPQFGTKPILSPRADYDGDGKTDVAVWDPSEGVFYVSRSSQPATTVQICSFGAKR